MDEDRQYLKEGAVYANKPKHLANARNYAYQSPTFIMSYLSNLVFHPFYDFLPLLNQESYKKAFEIRSLTENPLGQVQDI